MLCTDPGCWLGHDSGCLRYPAAHLRHLRQSKIQNLGVSAFRDEDIGGLDVTVDDAFGVGGIESIGDLNP